MDAKKIDWFELRNMNGHKIVVDSQIGALVEWEDTVTSYITESERSELIKHSGFIENAANGILEAVRRFRESLEE